MKDNLNWVGWFVVGSFGVWLLLRLFLWFVEWNIRSGFKGLQEVDDAVKGIPWRINLLADTVPSWLEDAQIKEWRSALCSFGFKELGAFLIPEMPEMKLFGAIHPDNNLRVILFTAAGKVCVDFCLPCENGALFVVTNVELGAHMKVPPWKSVMRFSNASPERLYDEALTQLSGKDLIPVSAAGFTGEYERIYAEQRDWDAERGGPTVEEMVASVDPLTPPKMEEIVVMREIYARKSLLHWWRMQPEVPYPYEVMKDCSAIVHDELSDEQLVFLFNRISGEWEADVKDLPAAVKTSRKRFAALNEKYGHPLGLIHVKATPLEADFYLCIGKDPEK